MRFAPLLAAASLAVFMPTPSGAVPGGEIATLPHGYYVCELPGDAAGPWRVRKPEEDFTVIGASNYRAGNRRGSYLLTGDLLTLTSGPFSGKRYHRQSYGFLRLIGDDGEPSELRCVLSSHKDA